MRIKRFEVVGLHGFIDTELDFFDEMTVIVGRNGAGKTSVLDMMAGLIRLDFKYLSKLLFSSASLFLADGKGKELVVRVRSEKNRKTLSINIGGQNIAEKDITEGGGLMDLFLKGGVKSAMLKKAKGSKNEFYDLFGATGDWDDAAKKLKESVHLTFVRLDRTIMAYDQDGGVSFDRGGAPIADKSDDVSTRDPIDDVNRVMRRKHLQFRRSADRIQRDASTDLIKLHFLPPKAILSAKASTEKALRQKIDELQERVSESHLIARSPELELSISDFFKQFSALMEEAFPKKLAVAAKIGRRTLQEETLEVMIKVKEQQISELLRIFQREQDDTAKAYDSIKRYLDVSSRFLKDSGKRLGFSVDTMELAFGLTSRVGQEGVEEFDSASARPIKELSSGEKQILIVLTYLAFLAGENSIFVIDEPELSLHIRWQAQLVDALRELQPKGCQIILATHAPEIAGKAPEKCQILRPSYLNGIGNTKDVMGELNG